MKKHWYLLAVLLLIGAGTAHAQEESEETGESETEEAPKKDKGMSDSDKKKAAEAAEAAEEAAEAAEAAEEAAKAAESTEEAVEAAEDAADAAEEAADAAEEAAEAAGASETSEDVPAEDKPEVSLVAEAGVVWLSGNTASINANGAIHFGIAMKRHSFALNFGGNYGKAVVDTNGDGKTEVGVDTWEDSARRVFGDARYDLSIIPKVNSVYVSGGAFHDPIGGYVIRARGDVGYAHKIVNTDIHKLRAEAGFNYTHELYVDDPTTPVDDDRAERTQNFFGARIFAGYAVTPNEYFGYFLNVETLLGGTDNQDARFDGRLILDTGITANISKIFSVKLGFLMNFDYVPPDVDGVEGPDIKPIDTTTTFTLVATLL